jgi:hypothetical protein
MPDYEKLPAYHYLPVSETTLTTEVGQPRPVDDYNPRANIRKCHKAKELDIQDFCDKFIVAQSYVEDYVNHLDNLDYQKKIRASV